MKEKDRHTDRPTDREAEKQKDDIPAFSKLPVAVRASACEKLSVARTVLTRLRSGVDDGTMA